MCLLSSTLVSENEFGSFRNTKNLTCNNCNNLSRQLQQDLRPNLPNKSNGEHFEKINIKTVITSNNISLFQTTVHLENSRLWDQIWPRERMIKILRNRHLTHHQYNTSNSYAKFHLIWRIIGFRSKITQNYF